MSRSGAPPLTRTCTRPYVRIFICPSRVWLSVVIWHSLDDCEQEIDMPTTIINLKVKTVEEKALPPQNKQLGNMIIYDDDITQINGDPSLRG